MNKIKVHVGYTNNQYIKENYGFKSFDFDLTKFPALFINWNEVTIFRKEPLMENLIRQTIELSKKTKNLKILIIDKGRVTHFSDMPDNCYGIKPKSALKIMSVTIDKIYKNYLSWPDFFPYTKYIILVNDSWSLAPYIADILPKLGAIGVYLVFSGGNHVLENNPILMEHLYGQIVYVSEDHYHGPTCVEAMPYGTYGFVMEQFKPEHKYSKAIYSDSCYKKFIEPPMDPISILFREMDKQELSTCTQDKMLVA